MIIRSLIKSQILLKLNVAKKMPKYFCNVSVEKVNKSSDYNARGSGQLFTVVYLLSQVSYPVRKVKVPFRGRHGPVLLDLSFDV